MLKIFGAPVSVHTRKVIVAALLKGLPHEVVPVVPVIPDSLPKNWRQLSPTGRIPAISVAYDEGKFTLADSGAICAYLERVHPGCPLYPPSERDYASALSLEQYAGALFREVVQPLFHETVVHPKMRNIPTDQKKVEEVLAQAVPDMFGYLNGIAGAGFLVGETMSIADIAVVSNLVTYQYLGFDLQRARHSQLAELHDRVVRQPAMREALRREKPVVDSMGLSYESVAPLVA